MPTYATLEDVEDVLIHEYGWKHLGLLNGSRDGDWCCNSRVYVNDRFPTWQLFTGNLGTNDAFAAIENDREQQFTDCDLFSWEPDSSTDELKKMLDAAERGAYDQFK